MAGMRRRRAGWAVRSCPGPVSGAPKDRLRAASSVRAPCPLQGGFGYDHTLPGPFLALLTGTRPPLPAVTRQTTPSGLGITGDLHAGGLWLSRSARGFYLLEVGGTVSVT